MNKNSTQQVMKGDNKPLKYEKALNMVHRLNEQRLRTNFEDTLKKSKSTRKIITAYALWKLCQFHLLDGSCNWNFEIKSLRDIEAVGSCNYKEQTIYLDSFWLNALELNALQEVVLHEIAHALISPHLKHGKIWRTVYVAVGGNIRQAPPLDK